jgi:hypothetical protein
MSIIRPLKMNAFYSLTPAVATLSAEQKCRIVRVRWTGEDVN